MNTTKNIFTIGILLLISGIVTALTSFEPSQILQYIFAFTALTVGIIAVRTGKKTRSHFVRSTYYSWIGFTSMALAVALGILAISSIAFINVVGLFLLIIGITEFVFAVQLLSYKEPIPWKLFGLKISTSALVAVGAGWILTMAGTSISLSVLVLGVVLSVAGLSFIQVSRWSKEELSLSR